MPVVNAKKVRDNDDWEGELMASILDNNTSMSRNHVKRIVRNRKKNRCLVCDRVDFGSTRELIKHMRKRKHFASLSAIHGHREQFEKEKEAKYGRPFTAIKDKLTADEMTSYVTILLKLAFLRTVKKHR